MLRECRPNVWLQLKHFKGTDLKDQVRHTIRSEWDGAVLSYLKTFVVESKVAIMCVAWCS